jgi:hypothetical protein
VSPGMRRQAISAVSAIAQLAEAAAAAAARRSLATTASDRRGAFGWMPPVDQPRTINDWENLAEHVSGLTRCATAAPPPPSSRRLAQHVLNNKPFDLLQTPPAA